jgi:hypothetical protein
LSGSSESTTTFLSGTVDLKAEYSADWARGMEERGLSIGRDGETVKDGEAEGDKVKKSKAEARVDLHLRAD